MKHSTACGGRLVKERIKKEQEECEEGEQLVERDQLMTSQKEYVH
jgi:hypothetical protein